MEERVMGVLGSWTRLGWSTLLLCALAACGEDGETLLLEEGSTRSDAIIDGTDAPNARIQLQGALFVPVTFESRMASPPGGFDADQKRYFYGCGANYIGNANNRHWAITAAHCVQGLGTVRLGFNKPRLSQFGANNTVRSRQIIVHPWYSAANHRSDIALVELEEAPSGAVAVQIPGRQGAQNPAGNVRVTIAGWGRTDKPVPIIPCKNPRICPPGEPRIAHNGDSDIDPVSQTVRGDKAQVAPTMDRLNEGESRVLGFHACVSSFPDLGGNQICALDNVGVAQGACLGDSAGPMYRNDNGQLVGLLSHVEPLCDPATPQIYTRIQTFRDWIRNITRI